MLVCYPPAMFIVADALFIKGGNVWAALKKALGLRLKVKFSVTFTFVLKRRSLAHVLIVTFIHVKNMIKEYFLRALSNG
jgi:hypothetical protein